MLCLHTSNALIREQQMHSLKVLPGFYEGHTRRNFSDFLGTFTLPDNPENWDYIAAVIQFSHVVLMVLTEPKD
jgi:hypothetical protein